MTPSTDFIVADGIFIISMMVSRATDQCADRPNLADFLLRKDLKLSGDLEVIRISAGRPLANSLCKRLSRMPELTLASGDTASTA